MAYTPKTWQDGPQGGTPITAADLNHLETQAAEVLAALTGNTSVSSTDRAVIIDSITKQIKDPAVVAALTAQLGGGGGGPVTGNYVPLYSKGMREFLARSTVSATAQSNILIAGCSQSEGTGAGAFGRRWVDYVYNSVKKSFQPTGVAGGRGYLPAHYSDFTIPGPATAYGSPDGGNSGFGLGGRSYYMAGDNQGIRFDSAAPLGQLNGTSFDVVYLPLGNGGSITVTIDGVAQTPFSTTGPQTEYSTKRYTFSSAGKHDVTVAHTNGTANIVLNGVIEYNGDENSGVVFYDGSHFGWSTQTYYNALIQPGAWLSQVNKIKPSLIITDLHVNDYLNNVPVATMVGNYKKMIEDANSGSTFPPSFVIVHSFYPVHSTESTPAASWDAYYAGLQQVVDAYPNQVTVVDVSKIMPVPADDTTGMYLSDGIHQTAKGHGLQGAIIKQKLGL